MINGEGLDARQVLRNIEVASRKERAGRNKKSVMAAVWADCHPPESIDPAQLRIPGGDRPIHPGGDGTPALAGFCVAELATTMHVSTGSTERFIADALDLRHCLPRLWARVCRYQIDGWQARQVARENRHLTKEQVALVDADIAGRIGRHAWSQSLRRVQGKIIAVDAARIAEPAEGSAGEQGVCIGEINNRGQKSLFAKADAPDVIWFDAMVARTRTATEVGSQGLHRREERADCTPASRSGPRARP